MTVIMPLKDQTAAKLYQNNLAGEGGHYLLGANRHWHGGMHFTIDKPVQAIADGKLIAYRLEEDYLTAELQHSGRNPKNKYSNSFALIKHECTVKGRTLNYYSLYMHLMPASGYKAKPKMAIPDFIRVMEGSDKDAVIQVREKQIDIPGGLNIRDLKTGDIVTVAPIGSVVSLDNNVYSEAQLTRYTANVARNSKFKKITFIDHKEKTHNGYALLDDDRVKKDGDHYTIITQEDPLKSGDANALKGLKLRSKQNYDDDTIIKILKNGTKVKIEIIDTQWAEVKEIDGSAPAGVSYIYHKNRVKFDENDIDEALLGKVHSLNQKITAGDLLGNPGVNFSQNNCLHFEIFSDDSIVNFIEDHKNLKESEKTILQINKGSKLFQRKKVDVPKAVATIKKYSRIKIEDTDANSEYVKITATGVGSLALSSDMEGYDENSEQYKGIKENLEKYKAQISNELNESTRLDFIYYANAAGDVTARAVPGHRLVAYPIAATDQKAYWVKRDLINSQNITTDDKDKGTILFNSLNMLYEENPIKFIFQEESALGSSDDCLTDLAECKTCKDSDGDLWYEVELPFDDKGFLHYLSRLNGVNRTNQEKGWVKASDTKLTSPLNWPGFKLAKEAGKGSKDARIDYNNLTPFFKELFEDIDSDGNGAISAGEMKAALRDDLLSDRLSRVIAKHPSEWHVDAGLTKWQYLNEVITDNDELEEAKTQIKNMAWWDDALCSGADFPMFPDVYHLHPIAAIGQLAEITKGKGIGYNTYENSVEILTTWKKGFGRQIAKQNEYNKFLMEAGKEHPDIDLLVFKSIIAQESGFDKAASNSVGYAGLTQVGWKTWKLESQYSLGSSSEGREEETGEYFYDLITDERFDPPKSILGGMRVLKNKIKYLDGKINKYKPETSAIEKYNPKISMLERYKLYIASYNGGQGTIEKCLIAADKAGVKNPVFDSFLAADPSNSILWEAIPESWGREDKYDEISEYVENVINRIAQ